MTAATSAPPRLPVDRASNRRRPRVQAVWIVLGLMIAGGALRVWGVAWGMPGGLHPDEWAIVDTAVDMAARNSFDPDIYLRPNHLEAKASLIGFQLYAYVWAGVPVEVAFAESRDPFLIVSRFVTAFFGVAMIPLAYAILAAHARRAGVIAAALVAVSPFYVEHSHFATPDVPLTAMIMIGMLGLSRYVGGGGQISALLLACAGTGLALTSKYPAAIFTVVIAIAVIVVAWQRRSPWVVVRHGLISLVATGVSVFLASPSLVMNADRVVAALEQESRDTHDGADGLGFVGNVLFYGEVFAVNAGLIMLTCAVVGAAYAIRRRMATAIPLAAGVVFWLALSSLSLHWDRWAAPMVITGLMFAALGAHAVLDAARQVSKRGIVATIVALLVVALVASTVQSIAHVARFSAPDTRLDSRPALEALGATRANTVYEGYTPFLPNAPLGLFTSFTADGGRLIPVDETRQFIVLSELQWGRYEGNDRHRDRREFYRALRAQFPVEQAFVPTVPAPSSSVFEWVQLTDGLRTIREVARGGATGPLIEVLRIPER